MAENTAKPTVIPVELFTATDPNLVVPVGGLLHAKPELRDAQKTPDQWQKLLADYLKTPRP